MSCGETNRFRASRSGRPENRRLCRSAPRPASPRLTRAELRSRRRTDTRACATPLCASSRPANVAVTCPHLLDLLAATTDDRPDAPWSVELSVNLPAAHVWAEDR